MVEKSKTLKARISTLLMALFLIFGIAGQSVFLPVAYANPTGGSSGASSGTTGQADGIFGMVGDTGSIDPSGGGVDASDTAGSISTVLTKYRTIAVAITGILTITMLILMLFQFTKLGAAGDNQQARSKAIMGILTTGIATALLGGATVVIGFFWGALS